MNIQTIQKRKSVRTYEKKDIDEKVRKNLEEYISGIRNPFDIPVELKLLDGNKDQLSSNVISGADLWLAGKVSTGKNADVAYGYTFEKAILYATDLGLGTVWLASTFDHPAFEKAMHLSNQEIVPAVSPIGYAAAKRSVKESVMRKGMKSDSRDDFQELFYRNDFTHALSENDAGKWKELLECVQWAPSATNKQPWRLIVSEDDKNVYFYEKHTRKPLKGAAIDIQKVDMGIALCHFEIAADEKNMKGHVIQKDPGISHDPDTDYILTYTFD